MPQPNTFVATFRNFDYEYNLATRVLGKPGKPLGPIVINVKFRMIALRKSAVLMDRLTGHASSAGPKRMSPHNVRKLISSLEGSCKSLNTDLQELSQHVDTALELPTDLLSDADKKRIEALDVLKRRSNALANTLQMQTQIRVSNLKNVAIYSS